MLNLRQTKRVTLPSGRTFLAIHTRRNKANLPANATIKGRYKRRRNMRDQRGRGLSSLGRKAFAFLKRFGFVTQVNH